MTSIRHRGGTASQWTTANPVLDRFELGFESDTRKAKLGDGATAWNNLPYAVDPGWRDAVSSLSSQVQQADDNADQALSQAGSALSAANAVAQTANDAKTAANNATTAANNASQAASDAAAGVSTNAQALSDLTPHVTALETRLGATGTPPASPVTFTYASGWSTFNPAAGFGPGQYRRYLGRVYLTGMVTGGTGTIATLPSGFRPSARKRWAAVGNAAFASVDVLADGTVTLTAGSASSYLSLDGINFLAA